MLAQVANLSGNEHTRDDARGRVEWVVRRLPDRVFLATTNRAPARRLVSYRTGFE
ncbi:MAG: hypothetical protein ACKPGK_10355 [Verrucomicrobiota bacterium]